MVSYRTRPTSISSESPTKEEFAQRWEGIRIRVTFEVFDMQTFKLGVKHQNPFEKCAQDEFAVV